MRWQKTLGQTGGISRLRQKTHRQKHRFSFTRNTPVAIELSQCLLRVGADRAAQRYEESCSRSEQDFDAERL